MISTLLILCPISVHASQFDTLLTRSIKDEGIYNNGSGIIYAQSVDNDTIMVIISVKNDSIVINAYGTESEPADTLTLKYTQYKYLTVSVYNGDDDFYLCLKSNNKIKCYRLINDAFIPSPEIPSVSEKLLSSAQGKLTLHTRAEGVYDILIRMKENRIRQLPSDSISKTDLSELLTLIKCCADIEDYTSEDDIDLLMRRVLYTHRNFMLISELDPKTGKGHNDLKLCSEKYISDVVYKAFRRDAPSPAINMLTDSGYCVNKSNYYYYGGYDKYFATDVLGITRVFYQSDGSLYIIFSDVYTEAGNEPMNEYSTATAIHDESGWYISSIHMNGDMSDILSPKSKPLSGISGIFAFIRRYAPYIVIFCAIAAAALAVYLYFF